MRHQLKTILALIIALVAFTVVQAQEGQSTLTPEEHDAHHATPEATETPIPETSPATGMGQMGDMAGMDMEAMMQEMGGMMGMDMPDDMRAQMEVMRSMMAMMMSGEMMPGMDMTSMMQHMMAMMDTMMGMDMSDDMHTQMERMHDMMTRMMAGETTPEPVTGMQMDSGYSVDDLAPLALAYYKGGEIYFIHPEASDAGVAEVLTNMMGTDVIVVPGLAEVPEELLGNVFVFTNGIDAMGPLGFQPDVFDSVPGDESYTPLRIVNLVTWQDDAEARELTSADEILTAEEKGEVIIERPGVVVNMPILVWPEGRR